jgi:hypothetical protein
VCVVALYDIVIKLGPRLHALYLPAQFHPHGRTLGCVALAASRLIRCRDTVVGKTAYN